MRDLVIGLIAGLALAGAAVGGWAVGRRRGPAPPAGEDPAAARRREEEARAAADAARIRAEQEDLEARRGREEAEDAIREWERHQREKGLDERLLEYDGGPLPGPPRRLRPPGGG